MAHLCNVMSVSTRREALACLAMLACSLTGCGTHEQIHEQMSVGEPGRYAAFYRDDFARNIIVPEVSAIQKVGQTWTYARPFEEVWEASRDVLSQYQGILAMNSSSSRRSMLVLKGRELKRAPDNRSRQTTFGGFYEQWLAIAITQEPYSDVTEVALATYDPVSRCLLDNKVAAQRLFSDVQINLYSVSLWREKFISVKNSQNKTNTAGRTRLTTVEQSHEYGELEQLLGGWISKQLRTEFVTVRCPEIESCLGETINRLKIAAGVPDLSTRVVVFGASDLNAFALPNGEVFVTSGLLDSLDTEDEIAAVLAHELDHLIHHDAVERLRVKKEGQKGSDAIGSAEAIVDVTIQILNERSSLSEDFAERLVRRAVRVGADRWSQHMKIELVSDFSAETELRADVSGAKMLYAVGIDPEANLRMLYVLRDLHERTLEKNEVVMSNLINMRPGIHERIKNLEEVLAEIQK